MTTNPQHEGGDPLGALMTLVVVGLVVAALDSEMKEPKPATIQHEPEPEPVAPAPPMGRYDHIKRAASHIGRAVWPLRRKGRRQSEIAA